MDQTARDAVQVYRRSWPFCLTDLCFWSAACFPCLFEVAVLHASLAPHILVLQQKKSSCAAGYNSFTTHGSLGMAYTPVIAAYLQITSEYLWSVQAILEFDANTNQLLERDEFLPFLKDTASRLHTGFHDLADYLLLLAVLDDDPYDHATFLVRTTIKLEE